MNGKNIGITIGVIIIAIIVGTLIWRTPSAAPQTACTTEAKLCPDGSAVGRTGPNCEFTACPQSNGLKTATTNGITFQYPDPLPTTYMHAQEWPPTITVTNGALTCTAKKIINNSTYCVTATNEGAAGSTYTTYSYATEKSGKVMTLSFIIRAVQCMNYDDPKQTECLKERAAFNADTLADQILRSAQ